MKLLGGFKRRLRRMTSTILRQLEYSYDSRTAKSSELQCLLKSNYRILKGMGNRAAMPSLKDVGFQTYSQFEEDGILLYLFSIVGTSNKRIVEMCVGNGRECMATNLIINHGWEGLLFDGDADQVKSARDFFREHPSTFACPPAVVHAWLDVDNVNALISEYGFSGEVDLLSLDIDGNDYWLLKSITAINPKIIICETQDIIPSHLSFTIPYDPNFSYHKLPKEEQDFRGMSLLAANKLCSQKGYRLIGSHRYGFNVIFMRNDTGLEYFPEVSLESVHANPWTRFGQRERWPRVKDLKWVEV